MRKMGMSEKRFTWKTEKLQHFDDEVLLVVDNENKEWKGHILNIVDLLNELTEENEQLREDRKVANDFIVKKGLDIEYYKYWRGLQDE